MSEIDNIFYDEDDGYAYLKEHGYTVVYMTRCKTLYCNPLACEAGFPQYAIETKYYDEEADYDHKWQYKIVGYEDFMQAVSLMKE